LLTADGTCKLADFGLAAFISHTDESGAVIS
jgi:hypothetical protein